METRLTVVPWWEAALNHLKSDSTLSPLIENARGDGLMSCTDLFSAMVRAVCGQQVSNVAAVKAKDRVLKAAHEASPGNCPLGIHTLGLKGLKGLGLSGTKQSALSGLARGFLAGTLTQSALSPITDEEVLARLTAIKGVGPWTGHMILIFGLNRPDVFPLGDYGLKAAGLKLFGNLDTMLSVSDTWRPYRTAATWLLWRDRTGFAVRY